MTRERERLPIDTMVSEDAAHRVLARAVELDARLADQVSITRLREVAREAGIAPAAFDEALKEFQLEQTPAAEPKAGFFRWLWPGSKKDKWQSLTSNLTAFGAFVVLMVAIGRTNRALDWNWQTYHAVMTLCAAGVTTFAVKYRARPAAIYLGTLTAALTARYVIHVLFGIQTVQGGSTQWALMLSSLLGIGFGALLLRTRKSTDSTPPNADNTPVAADVPIDAASERRPPASLMLRTT